MIYCQLNLLNHSFHIEFSTKLWRDTSYIEVVKQTIGHAKMTTTSLYISVNQREKLLLLR